ncbi:hypothetical protein Ciccas_002362 [Cichlidogyrus casuarinus]|uniref:Uncharacterized protein n=1 Tax=Cichlidogyrus casuarinus TaxID=1844966 RepID=A0ABD2QIE8_9PLAT
MRYVCFLLLVSASLLHSTPRSEVTSTPLPKANSSPLPRVPLTPLPELTSTTTVQTVVATSARIEELPSLVTTPGENSASITEDIFGYPITVLAAAEAETSSTEEPTTILTEEKETSVTEESTTDLREETSTTGEPATVKREEETITDAPEAVKENLEARSVGMCEGINCTTIAPKTPKFDYNSTYNIWIFLLLFTLVSCAALAILVFAVLLCYIGVIKRNFNRKVYGLEAELKRVNEERAAPAVSSLNPINSVNGRYGKRQADTYDEYGMTSAYHTTGISDSPYMGSTMPRTKPTYSLQGTSTFRAQRPMSPTQLDLKESVEEQTGYESSTYKGFEDPAKTPDDESTVNTSLKVHVPQQPSSADNIATTSEELNEKDYYVMMSETDTDTHAK